MKVRPEAQAAVAKLIEKLVEVLAGLSTTFGVAGILEEVASQEPL